MKCLIIAILLLTASITSAANITMEIIAPRAGLTTANRYYRAYPGITYEVPVAVLGGTYPFTYALTTAPSGMSINSSTGIITWSNPTESGSPHNVTVRVTDADSTQVTVSWTLTVTTTGFIFVDGSVGSSGSGTLASPFKTIGDFYVSKHDSTYASYFVYFKTGSGNYSTGSPMTNDDGNWLDGEKPRVLLAYPGDTPVIDTGTARFSVEGGMNNLFVGGITFTGAGTHNQQWRVGTGGTENVFYKNHFTSLPAKAEGTNNSCVFLDGGAGNYKVFIGNTFDYINSGYGILMYDANKIVIADNTVNNITNTLNASHVFGLKCNDDNASIRNNSITGIASGSDAIHPQMICTSASTNIDVSFNNCYGSPAGSCVSSGDSETVSGSGPLWYYRNTFTGGVNVTTLTGVGPVYFDNNVIQNSDTGDHINDVGSAPSTIVATNDLTGTSGLVDSSGLLVNRSYVGTYGWETTAVPSTGSLRPGVSASGVTFR